MDRHTWSVRVGVTRNAIRATNRLLRRRPSEKNVPSLDHPARKLVHDLIDTSSNLSLTYFQDPRITVLSFVIELTWGGTPHSPAVYDTKFELDLHDPVAIQKAKQKPLIIIPGTDVGR